jgi:quinoprotein glucose dehydrogenase
MAERDGSRRRISITEPGAWLMAASSAAGLLASLIDYFWRGDGIAYTPGALLVIISTGLLLAASLVMATNVVRHWLLSEFFTVATCLDILGTVFAAWLLEAHWLLALMVLSAVGWIIHIAFDAPAQPDKHEHSARLQRAIR